MILNWAMLYDEYFSIGTLSLMLILLPILKAWSVCMGVWVTFSEIPVVEEWLHGPVKVFSVSVNLRQFE